MHLAKGLLADTEVKEARERVRAATQNSGLAFPQQQAVTLNLAPADLPKNPADLPIALGILAPSGQLDAAQVDRFEFAGELSLGGDLRPVRGVLAIALALKRHHTGAAGRSMRTLVVPHAGARDAAQVEGLAIHGGEPARGRGRVAAARRCKRDPGARGTALRPALSHDDALESAAVLSLTGAFTHER